MIKAFLVSTKDLKFKLVCRQNLDFILRLTKFKLRPSWWTSKQLQFLTGKVTIAF